jgi:DNA-directed RNA polymerase subunit RPC12/RpoP
MKRTLRKQKSMYALSLIFCLVGIVSLLSTIYKTYPQLASSKDPFSTFLSLLWTEKITLISGLEFKLIYLVILGDVMLVSGVILWLLSRQWFLIPGKIVWFQCPFCKKKWKSTGDKALVHCPHCRQLVHPKITEK